MSITISIPTYNRFGFTIQCVEPILYNEKIDEIVIVDDLSTDNSYELLRNHFRYDPKVKLYQNSINIDCFFNKKRAIELASNEWVIIFDSDNILDESYLDAVFNNRWDEKTILAPVWAYPNFNYTAFEGLTINKENVAEYMNQPMFETALNTFNLFVNRDEFLKVWDGKLNPMTSDSIYFNYLWLNAGNKIHFTKGMQYFHRVHPLSHYQNKNHLTPDGFHASIIHKLKEMK